MSKEYVLVTTISHFKLKYAIPLEDFEKLGFGEPIDQTKLSKFVSDGNVKEFSQANLGENVCDVSVYEEKDLLELFRLDNGYLADWPTPQKVEWINNWQET